MAHSWLFKSTFLYSFLIFLVLSVPQKRSDLLDMCPPEEHRQVQLKRAETISAMSVEPQEWICFPIDLTNQTNSQPISQRQDTFQTGQSDWPSSVAALHCYRCTIVILLDAAGSRTSDNALSLKTQESSLCQRLPLPSSSLSHPRPTILNPFTPPCGSAVISSLSFHSNKDQGGEEVGGGGGTAAGEGVKKTETIWKGDQKSGGLDCLGNC